MDYSDPIVVGTIVSDIIICLSYFAIPIELWFFQRSLTRPLPFKYVLVFFELFILACGITHLVAVWSPWTRTDAALLGVKILCAVISFTTACVLVFVIPKVFSLPVKTALLQEELGFRIKHEQSLQVANDSLRKFRKITNHIRKTLDIDTICEVVVSELAENLSFSGIAIFIPDEVNGELICYSEYVKTHNKIKEDSGIKAHYWKTINVDPSSDIVRRITGVACAFHMNPNDMVDLVNKQRGILYRSGIAMSFSLIKEGAKGFILGFCESASSLLNEDELELFEDIVGQTEIALQQANQIKMESYHLKKIQSQFRNNQNLFQLKQDADINNLFKSKLINNLKTELQSPISDFTNLITLISQTNLNDKQRDMLELLKISSESLELIAKDLDDFIKVEKGQLKLSNIKFNIQELLKNVVDQQDSFAGNKMIQIRSEVDEAVPLNLVGDSVRLRQALSNLVNNAIKFSSLNSDVLIYVSLNEEPPATPYLNDIKCCQFDNQLDGRMYSRGSRNLVHPVDHDPTLPRTHLKTQVYFHVIDYGQGMRSDQVSRLIRTINHFDFDTNSSTFTNEMDYDHSYAEELGLGLLITGHLTKLFNGCLSIRSCKGKGSIFSFSAKLFIAGEN